MLKVKDLDKYFNKKRANEIHVINDATFELPEKGMVAIFGRSGCGKTTLLNVIGGLDSFSGGSVTVDGRSIKKDTDVVRNKYIGYIFQNYNLNNSLSSFENVAAALRLCGVVNEEEIEERVKAALLNVGMEKYGKRTPDTLSGGQQQRIAIARAIVKNPAIILADEPTGNLDEINTVNIMNLLKAISKERLVIIVTHEANLVDYYCDTVIEISDGKIIDARTNENANGYSPRSKNDIWLGELDKREYLDECTHVEFYGEKPKAPLNLKIVNHGGRLYVQLGSEKVQILDETSEIKLKEGSFKEQPVESFENISMGALPPIKGKRFGKLFGMKAAILDGYAANFKNSRKKGKRFLQACMALFAMVLVLTSAVFGTAFCSIFENIEKCNQNTFYVYTPDRATVEQLRAGMENSESGVEYLRLIGSNYYGSFVNSEALTFLAGNFESQIGDPNWTGLTSTRMSANAVILGERALKGCETVCGKSKELAKGEMVVTTALAKDVIEASPFGYISKYEDILGMICEYGYDYSNYKVVGIVKSGERNAYINDTSLAETINMYGENLKIASASDYGKTVKDGEAFLYIIDDKQVEEDKYEYPSIGGKIKINGVQLTVTQLLKEYASIDEFLAENNIEFYKREAWMANKVHELYPELVDENSSEFKEKMLVVEEQYAFEYLLDHVFCHIDDMAAYYKKNEMPGSFFLYIYSEMNVDEAMTFAYNNDKYETMEIYAAYLMKKETGKYPTVSEAREMAKTLPGREEIINEWEDKYRASYERWKQERNKNFPAETTYILSNSDYIDVVNSIGDTDPTAKRYDYGSYLSSYTLVHSNDNMKTKKWLNNNFSHLESNDPFTEEIIDPTEEMIKTVIWGIVGSGSSFAVMAAVFLLMSFCVYFIMRSSLMGRIREVGIYRAIGVSKKNLIFKFFIEAVVLNTLIVLVAFLVISIILFVITGASSILSSVLFYPVWYAVIVLAAMSAVTVFFGTLPIIMLLRKTPSQILSKYDI